MDPITLTVTGTIEGELQTGTYRYVFDQDEILVGRGPHVEVRLPHPTVSMVHLRLLRKKGRLWVTDAGSKNGTLVDGVPLPLGKAAPLKEGTRLTAGLFEILIGEPAREPVTPPGDTAAFARQMVLELLGAVESGCQCFLVVDSGPQRGERLELPVFSPPLRIGRGESCDLKLVDADVSRQHVEIQTQGEEIIVRDLGSKNGFWVNGAQVTGSGRLHDGDTLRIGNTTLKLTNRPQRYLQALEEPGPKIEPLPADASPRPGREALG